MPKIPNYTLNNFWTHTLFLPLLSAPPHICHFWCLGCLVIFSSWNSLKHRKSGFPFLFSLSVSLDAIFCPLFLQPFCYIQSSMEALSLPSLWFLGFTHSCWPLWLIQFLLTVLFVALTIDLPAGLVGYLLHLPHPLPNIIYLFKSISSLSHFSKNSQWFLCSFLWTLPYPSSHSTTIFLILILYTLTFHIPLDFFPILSLTALICLPSNPL